MYKAIYSFNNKTSKFKRAEINGYLYFALSLQNDRNSPQNNGFIIS